MAWHATDTRNGQEVVLVMPRVPPPDGDAAELWTQRVRKAGRLDHPNLAVAVEMGSHDGWPFVVHDLEDCATLSDRIGNKGLGGVETAMLVAQVLQGLAFAHDAGVVHRDVQPFMVLSTDKGAVRLIGLEVAPEPGPDDGKHSPLQPGESTSLRAQREAAQADVLQAGLLLHHALAGAPALDEPDTAKAAQRLPPIGRDIVRLPWTTPRPIPEALRAIVNRASDRQERQRYRSARTLVHALEGWLKVETSNQGGPLVLLIDRIRTAGVLPASPNGAARVARLALMEREHNSELAQVAIADIALSFELLRAVNMAQLRSGQLGGSGPVLTVRRAIAMLGLEGVRRAALALRPWPGALRDAHAEELTRLFERTRRAAYAAVALRPAGYDSEVVFLVTLLQNLGRMVVQYHFADEAQQIRRLMQPAPADNGEGDDPGMSEQAAAFAVLGVDIEAIGNAVARHWGMDDSVMHMMRRISPTAVQRSADSDGDALRAVASCANDAIDALALPAPKQAAAMQAIVQRYGRMLGISLRDLQAALKPGSGLETAADLPPAPPPTLTPAATARHAP
jgi:non-specific serine/threonine protein kinase